MIYNGPAFDVGLHFSKLGYTPSQKTNVADFAMDVLGGFVPNDQQTIIPVIEINNIFAIWWQNNRRDHHMAVVEHEMSDVDCHRARMMQIRDRRAQHLDGTNSAPITGLTYWQVRWRNFGVGVSRQVAVSICVYTFLDVSRCFLLKISSSDHYANY